MTRVELTPAELTRTAERALVRAGTSPSTARLVAEAAVDAEAAGLASHGLAYVPTYCEHVRIGKVAGGAEPSLERVEPALLAVDAASGFPHAAIDLGFASLVPLAREMGIAALAVRNSYNCGLLGAHTDRLARAGLVGLGFTNAPASIAPAGGAAPVIGTNPIALSVPDGAGGVAIAIDQSASVVARSEVMRHAREGRPLTPGWALDAEGRPTTDPALALKGSMAPAGGYKGVGLGLIVEIFAAAATGATLGIDASPFSGPVGGPPRTGQFFIALDAGASSGGFFAERLARLVAAVAAQPGARLPGARKAAARRASAARGTVAVDADVYARVLALADGPD